MENAVSVADVMAMQSASMGDMVSDLISGLSIVFPVIGTILLLRVIFTVMTHANQPSSDFSEVEAFTKILVAFFLLGFTSLVSFITNVHKSEPSGFVVAADTASVEDLPMQSADEPDDVSALSEESVPQGEEITIPCSVGDTFDFMGQTATIESQKDPGWYRIQTQYGENYTVSKDEINCR